MNNMERSKKKKHPVKYEIMWAVIIIALILLPQLIGTTKVVDESQGLDENGCPVTSTTFEDLEAPGTVFGTLTITEWQDAIEKRFPKGVLRQYNTVADSYQGLEAGETDAALGFIDERQTLASTHPNLAFITEPFAAINFGFGTQKNEKGDVICKEMNQYLAEIKGNGVYDALREKWEDPNRSGDVMGKYEFSGEKGTLRVSTGGLWTPMTFYVGETLTGEFIEIVNGFCAAFGYTPQYEVVAKSAEMTGLASGIYDICADSISPSPERLETINVTDTLMTDEYYLLVRREPVMKEVSKASVFFKNMKDSIRRTFFTEDRYKILLSGLKVTILLSLVSGVFGTLLGVLICYLRTRNNPFVSMLASLYIRIFRSLPVVVLLLVLNYLVFGNSGLNSFWICAITFSIEFSAYCSEIFRSGINAVPPGQAKAATALGFGKLETFHSVILPQALVHFLPPYSGQLIATVKMTSVAGYISVIDLTKASDIIRSRTYEAFFPLLFTSVVYFLLCILLISLLRAAEKRIHPQQRHVRKEIVEIVEAFHGDDDKAFVPLPGAEKEKSREVLIHAEHLKKSFENVTPVKDLSFEIHNGDVVAVIGPSGTGKSTLLNLMNHLETADSGTLLFEGQDTFAKGYDVNHMRQQIGMVFQSFNLFSHLTVIENLMLAQTKLLKRSQKEAGEKSMQLLQMVGLTDKALTLPEHLSGGQQQRVAIVRAVAMDPRILLFDEPTSALDPTMIGEVLSVIRRLAAEGMNMMIVTHEMSFAREVSNRVFFMDEGIIYEEGIPEEIFEAPKKEKTRQFIRRLKVFETSFRKNSFDSLGQFAGIEQFGIRHMISRRLINSMLTVAEELCLQLILPTLGGGDELHLLFEYSDTGSGSVDMEVSYPGRDVNPLEEGDPLSVTMTRHVCRALDYKYIDGCCRITGTLSCDAGSYYTG